MTTVVFVHGTGVRRRSYDDSLGKARVALNRAGLEVKECYWGHLGAGRAALSIPAAGGAPKDPEKEYEISLWGALYDDPFYELRILELRERKGKGGLGQLPPGKQLAKVARKYTPSDALAGQLRAAGLDALFARAQEDVVESPVFDKALESASDALEEYRAAIARAWIARAIQLRREGDPDAAMVRADQRDELVRLLIEELGGRELAFSDWAKKGFLSLGTRLVKDNRDSLSSGASPIAGDILLYQARGDQIRGEIEKAIADAEPPVVVLAHSLGGIATVDLLATKKLAVHALITVGSQAPLFHEIGALGALERGSELPAHFPRWLNIWDARDFLSYVGDKIFPGRIEDVEVDNGQPFPVSHSAYWENDHVWIAIGKELP